MPADWPAPMPEGELLALVHRRARVISARRMTRRAVPVLLVAATVAGSLSVLDRGSPSAVRMADHDSTSQEQAQAADERAARTADAPVSGAGLDGRAQETAAEAGSGEPGTPPQVAASTASRGPVPQAPLVTDPSGDDRPRNAGVDLLWGDISYDQATDSLRFTMTMARLVDAPQRVSYGFGFDYYGGRYGVSVERWDDGSSTVLIGNSCPECSVVYDSGTNAVHIVVPRSELDERIAYDAAHTYSADAPTGARPPPPPLRRGAVFSHPRLRADLSLEAPLTNANPDGPNDVAESDGTWTMP